ncbi:MAG: T9SS type A sorting domain-containing protein [Bacteroidia bacterium]|nr:T9SS type A sorting domain-containing protein [Bacteroidia bacterium]
MQSGKPVQQDFDFFASYKKVKDGISNGIKIHKSLDALINSLDDTAGGTPAPGKTKVDTNAKSGVIFLASKLLDSDFLKEGLKVIPYVGEAVELLSIFASGGKAQATPQTLTLSPLSTNSTLNFSGTITSSKLYKTININTPGSNWTGNQGDFYPYYDEVLGVMNLLESPKIDVRMYQNLMYDWEYGLTYDLDYRHQIQLHEDVSYVLNPAVLDTTAFEVMASIFITWNPYCNLSGYEGLIPVRANVYRTPFLPIACLRDYIFDYEVDTVNYAPSACVPIDLKFQLLANLKIRDSDTAQNILFIGMYETNGTLIPYPSSVPPNIPPNPFTRLLGENVTLENLLLEAGETYYATQSFVIGPGVTVSNGGSVTIIAGNEITVLPGVELLPGITLQTGQSSLCDRIVFPQRQAKISQVCSSSQYQGRTLLPKYPGPGNSGEPTEIVPSLTAFPNPFTGEITLEFDLPETTVVSITLYDLLGRPVMPIRKGEPMKAGPKKLTVEMGFLAAGLYHVVLEAGGQRQAVKVVKE